MFYRKSFAGVMFVVLLVIALLLTVLDFYFSFLDVRC